MLTVAEIKHFINDDIASERKRRAKEGQRYAEGVHDILQNRLFYFNADGKLVEDNFRTNIKICHPFFMELAEQLPAYMLSFKKNPIRAKENVKHLQEYLDEYFDDEFWTEIGELIGGAYTKGFEYLYAKKNDQNKLVFECADSIGVVEVRAKDTDDHCEYVIYWYIDRIEKGKKEIKRILVWSEKEVAYFVQKGDGAIEIDKSEPINPRPHFIYTDTETGKQTGGSLGKIPFWRLDNNKKRQSGLKPIKGLIDDYDRMQCGLSNNLTDFDTPLYFVTGYPGDNLDELQQNLKTKKIVSVPDSEGGIEVNTVSIPYEARKAKADEDEKNIYRFGLGFNSSQVGDGNITNIVILSRYTPLELKATKMEKRVRKLLKELCIEVLKEINEEHKTGFEMSDIEFDFKREIPTNETENIQNERTKAETEQIRINTILMVAAQIGDEEILKLICDELDLNYDKLKGQVEQLQEEKKTAEAIKTLNGVVTEEEAPIE